MNTQDPHPPPPPPGSLRAHTLGAVPGSKISAQVILVAERIDGSAVDLSRILGVSREKLTSLPGVQIPASLNELSREEEGGGLEARNMAGTYSDHPVRPGPYPPPHCLLLACLQSEATRQQGLTCSQRRLQCSHYHCYLS